MEIGVVQLGPAVSLELGIRLIDPAPCHQSSRKTHVTKLMTCVSATFVTKPPVDRKVGPVVLETAIGRFPHALAGLAVILQTIGRQERQPGISTKATRELIDEQIFCQSKSHKLSVRRCTVPC